MCLETARVQSFLRSFSFHCRKEERINLGGKLQCRMKSACRLAAWKSVSYQIVFVPPWLKKTANIAGANKDTPSFVLEGPRPYKIFCFALIHESCDCNVSIGLFFSQK